MTVTRRPLAATLAATLLGAPFVARPGAAFPDRPVLLVVPFAPGGTTDIAARIVQPALAAALGDSVVIENRPGAGGAVASAQVKRAAADGHTLLLATASSHGVNPAVFADLPYDAEADFAPVALLGVTPLALAVAPSLGAHDVAGFLALMRANPGRFAYASAGVGSITHLAGEWLKLAAGLDVLHVPYRGGGPALEAVAKGEVAFTLETTATLAAALREGRVRGLAIATGRRSRAFPDLPTLDAAGVPGFDAYSWTMAVAPAGTPEPVRARLNAAFNAALSDPEVAARLAAIGTEVVADSTPASAAAHVASEIARWRRVVAEAGIRLERG